MLCLAGPERRVSMYHRPKPKRIRGGWEGWSRRGWSRRGGCIYNTSHFLPRTGENIDDLRWCLVTSLSQGSWVFFWLMN